MSIEALSPQDKYSSEEDLHREKSMGLDYKFELALGEVAALESMPEGEYFRDMYDDLNAAEPKRREQAKEAFLAMDPALDDLFDLYADYKYIVGKRQTEVRYQSHTSSEDPLGPRSLSDIEPDAEFSNFIEQYAGDENEAANRRARLREGWLGKSGEIDRQAAEDFEQYMALPYYDANGRLHEPGTGKFVRKPDDYPFNNNLNKNSPFQHNSAYYEATTPEADSEKPVVTLLDDWSSAILIGDKTRSEDVQGELSRRLEQSNLSDEEKIAVLDAISANALASTVSTQLPTSQEDIPVDTKEKRGGGILGYFNHKEKGRGRKAVAAGIGVLAAFGALGLGLLNSGGDEKPEATVPPESNAPESPNTSPDTDNTDTKTATRWKTNNEAGISYKVTRDGEGNVVSIKEKLLPGGNPWNAVETAERITGRVSPSIIELDRIKDLTLRVNNETEAGSYHLLVGHSYTFKVKNGKVVPVKR